MKRLIVVLILILLGVGFLISTFKNRLNKDLSQPVSLPTTVPTPIPTVVKNLSKQTNSLFVPYWALSNQPIDSAGVDKLIYFGISPTSDGINTSEPGSSQIQTFIKNTPSNTPKLLTIRMTNSQQNLMILKNQGNQTKIIDQTIQTAKQNGFNGVVLDLEISAIPFDNLVQQINSFVKAFSTQTKANNLSFAMTIYGDNFYRLRPFDLNTIAQYTDNILIMAYDFHKANGDPGPNFPLAGQETYGYDLGKMADDFLHTVPASKLTVVFGLFGYDWTLNNNQHSIGAATPLTDTQIQQKFLDHCSYTDCKIQKEPQSAETKITYTDDQEKKHIVWFENTQSLKQKEATLRQKGINSFSLWAYSYY